MSEFTDPSGRKMIHGIDIMGQPIAIGDHVAFPDGSGSPNSLRIGEVIVVTMGVRTAVTSPMS
ncbi:hypothetical protein Arash_gp74c [Salmonella phage Arash]|nr:hypothetical protein Arash_gp74c [Salmonella phage Arash]